MIKVKILENYREYKEGNLYNINENEAHTLIDNGIAELYRIKPIKYQDKMMRSKNLKSSK